MADEISQVQQTGVNPLWPIGGAAIGGVGTYYGVQKYASAPYSSHADLIKEENGKDAFNGKSVNGDQKNALKIAEDKFKAAEAKYDADLKAYQEANKFGVEETPEFKELVAKQQAAEKALAEKRALIEQETITAPKKDTTRAVKEAEAAKKALETEMKAIETTIKPINTTINTESKQLFKLLNELDGLEAKLSELRKKGGTEAQIAAKEKLVQDKKAKIEAFTKGLFGVTDKSGAHTPGKIEKEINKIEFQDGMSKQEIAEAKNKLYQDAKLFIEDIVAERTNNEYRKTLAKNTIKELGAKKAAAEELVANTYRDIVSESFSKDIATQKVKAFAEMTPEQLSAEIQRIKTVQQSKITKLESLKAKISADGTFKGNEKEIEELVRLGGNGKTDKEIIENAIKDAKQKIANLDNSIKNVDYVQKEIARLGGVKIEGGKLIDASGKEVKISYDKFELPERKLELKTPNLERIESKIGNIENEIAKQSAVRKLTAQEVEAKLANEVKAAQDAKAAVETAKANLPKTAERSAEDLTKEFIEKNGSKKDAITKALKESEAELKPLFEKKWGTGKVAGAVAAGAAVVGALAYLMAPKGDRA